MRIGQINIDINSSVYVIAEIGVNHEGCVNRCLEMVLQAAKAGANAIKLQSVPALLNYAKGTDAFKLFSKCELTNEETAKVFDYSRSIGVEPLTTVGDFSTLEFVKKLNPNAYKISSGLANHFPLLEEIAKLNKPTLLSTGMSDIADVQASVSHIRDTGNNDICVLQCTSLYPTPLDKVDINAMVEMRHLLKCVVGFSDHSIGDLASIVATALGAKVIEKHITFDKKRAGYDHQISLNYRDFDKFLRKIRSAERCLGGLVKELDPEMEAVKQLNSRKLVAAKNIRKGEMFELGSVCFLRLPPSQFGLVPEKWKLFENKRASRDIKKFDPLALGDID